MIHRFPFISTNRVLFSIGFSFSFGFGPSDNKWRRHRRIFHEYFTPEKIAKYQTSQLLEARRLLKRLLVDPEGFDHHIKQ